MVEHKTNGVDHDAETSAPHLRRAVRLEDQVMQISGKTSGIVFIILLLALVVAIAVVEKGGGGVLWGVPSEWASDSTLQRHCERVVKRDIDSRVNDPSGLEIVAFNKVQIDEPVVDGGLLVDRVSGIRQVYYIQCRFRTGNLTGTLMLETREWKIQNGRVLKVEPCEDF